MSRIFISYSRKDSAGAQRLVEALKQSDLDAWIDWEDIPPTAEWEAEIRKGIVEADGFLFLVSPDSVKSKVCGQEIDWAVENGKRLLPVVLRDVDQEQVHPTLARINWIFLRAQDDFQAGLRKILDAIRTDLAWVEAHRRLQVRALEWERLGSRSLLLRGDDLRKAEEQLASAHSKDPQPTDLQRKFVLESRRSASRTRNLIGLISIIAAAALAVATVIAVIQSGEATKQANAYATEANSRATAESNAINAQATTVVALDVTEDQLRLARNRQLSAQAELLFESSPSTALLLALEAIRLNTDAGEPVSLEARQALRDALSASAGLPLPADSQSVNAIAVSPDGRWLAAAGYDQAVLVWDLNSSDFVAGPALTLIGHTVEISLLSFAGNDHLISVCADGQLLLWDLTAADPGATPRALTGAPVPFDALASSPEGHWLAGGSAAAHEIVLWDLSSAESSARVLDFNHGDLGDNPELSIAFSPNGNLFAASLDKKTQLWTLSGSQPVSAGTIQFHLVQGATGYFDSYNPARSLVFSSDGRYIFSGSEVGIAFCAVRIFPECPPAVLRSSVIPNPERQTGIASGRYPLNIIAVSPDGHWLASGSSDGLVRLWDISSDNYSREPVILEGHNGPVTALAFSGDGRWLTSGSGDATMNYAPASGDRQALLWDLQTVESGPAPQTIPVNTNAPLLLFTPAQNWLVTTSDRRAVRLLDPNAHGQSPDPIALAPIRSSTLTPNLSDDALVLWDESATSIGVNRYQLIDLSAPDPMLTITSWETYYGPVKVSPNGRWAAFLKLEGADAVGRAQVSLQLIDRAGGTAATARNVWQPDGAKFNTNWDYGFSLDSRWLIAVRTYGDNYTNFNPHAVVIWAMDLSAPGPDRPTYFSGGAIISSTYFGIKAGSLNFSEDGRWVSYDMMSDRRLIDLQRADPLASSPSLGEYDLLRFSPDGRWAVVFGEMNNNIGIIDLQKSDPVAEMIPVKTGVPFLGIRAYISPDSRSLLVITCDGYNFCEMTSSIELWSVDPLDLTPRPFGFTFENRNMGNTQSWDGLVSFSPDGRWIGLQDLNGNLDLVDLQAASAVPSLRLSNTARVRFSPDSRWLAWLDTLGNAMLYSLPDLQAVPVDNRGYSIGTIAFNQDGSLLAAGADSGRVLVWEMDGFNAASRSLMLRGNGSQSYTTILFSANNRWLFAEGASQPASLWRLDLDELLTLACQSAGRNLTEAEWGFYGFTDAYRATCTQWPLETQP